MYELGDTAGPRLVRDFLIRAYPRQHVESLQHKLFKSPEFCAACHKQFIDKEINRVGWVQLQNQFDAWRKSRWNHPNDPTKTVECRECHMPLKASTIRRAATIATTTGRRPTASTGVIGSLPPTSSCRTRSNCPARTSKRA